MFSAGQTARLRGRMVEAMASGKRPDRSPHSLRAGFTLVEVLVAFTILSLATIILQQAVAVTLDSTSRARERVEGEDIARTLLTGPIEVGADNLKPRSGQMNGYDWTLSFETTQLPDAPNPETGGDTARWAAVRMTVSVRGKSRNGVVVDSIRLVKVASR